MTPHPLLLERLLGRREALNQTLNRIAKLAVGVRVASYRRALRRTRTAAAIEHARILESLDLAQIVDVGANRGQFALVAQHVHPGAMLICVEPLPQGANVLRELFGNSDNVEVLEVALGATPSEANLFVTRADDNSSILPPASSPSWPGLDVVDHIEVSVKALDDVVDARTLPRPSLLKVDVQGSELDVLLGARASLAHFDHVYVEVSFAELYSRQPLGGQVIEFLLEQGFSVSNVSEVKTDSTGLSIQADILFSRADDAPGSLSF